MSVHSLKNSATRMINKYGSTIILHNNFGLPDATIDEARGYKTSEGEFLFSERVNIKQGTVLQIKGSNELWRVYDTNEEIAANKLVLFKVAVAKFEEGQAINRNSQESLRVSGGFTHIIFERPVTGGVQVGGSNNTQRISLNDEEEE